MATGSAQALQQLQSELHQLDNDAKSNATELKAAQAELQVAQTNLAKAQKKVDMAGAEKTRIENERRTVSGKIEEMRRELERALKKST
jgi:predicted  nucleic acid-binding Zn-ribbon protein